LSNPGRATPYACGYSTSFKLPQLFRADFARPILTYGRRGAKKEGINPEEHAIVYEDTPPAPMTGEARLEKEPIQLHVNTPRDKLQPESRVCYAKIHTVEHNLEVHFIGRLAKASMRTFIKAFDETWDAGFVWDDRE
jgi:hypothetical protein